MTLTADLRSFTITPSPVGPLTLVADGGALTGVSMDAQRHAPGIAPDWVETDEPFADAIAQLDEYFAGTRTEFELELRLDGTAFQRAVWSALREIPYGETISYGELARRVGNPNASRAVGLANGRNPIGIIVPCHRVIGSNGSMTGYGGGVERKVWLLEHEQGRQRLLA